MKKIFLHAGSILITLIFIIACSEQQTPVESYTADGDLTKSEFSSELINGGSSSGSIVIANRGSGNITVINAKTDQIVGTYDLPAGVNSAEPMYVVYDKKSRRVFVGDRGNNQVVVFKARNFAFETTIPAGAGVFHMWADPKSKQLWVNNDLDKTTTIVDPLSLNVLATVPTPADLVAMGGKPHDVILGPKGRFAYVTVVGVSSDSDYVVQYDTQTFMEIGRAAVGKDAHVSLTRKSKNLFVPCQNSNAVYILNRFTMETVEVVPVPGAHGAGMPFDGKTFYTTNLPGGGVQGLIAMNTRTREVIGTTDTPYPVPHNIALTHNGRKLYVTHSGATAEKVTVYKISKHNRIPVFSDEITVGVNPFGLAYIP